MRKFFKLAAFVGLALLVASPAMALDFKFGAEYRVRFYDGVAVGFENDVTGSNPRGAQVRIRPRFDVSDDNGNMTATLRLEIGDIEFGNGGGAFSNTNFGNPIGAGTNRVGNGAGGGGGADGVNVETKWAYMDFAMPGGFPLRLRAGLQPAYLPKGIVIDDDVAGVRAYGKASIMSYDFWWWRLSGGMATNANVSGTAGVVCVTGATATFTTSGQACIASGGKVLNYQGPNAVNTTNYVDNNYDVYGVKLDAAIHKAFNPGLYFLYVDNRIQCTTNDILLAGGTPCNMNGLSDRVRKGMYLGATATGDLNFMKWDLDFVYGNQKGGPGGAFPNVNKPEDVAGWAVDGHVGFPIGPVVLNIAGSYATGDKRDGGKSEAFPGGLAPSWNGPGGGFEMLGSGGPFDAVEFTQDGLENLWALGVWAEYRPVKALWLKAGYAYAGFAEKWGNCAVSVTGANSACYGPRYGASIAKEVKSSLGQEISLRADYDLWTNFKIQGQAAWFIPSAGDTAAEYVLQFLYNF